MKGRIIGVDFGKKRVGVAISDPLGLFAIPVGTYTPDDSISAIEIIKEEKGIEHIIIGWPLTEQGEEEEATEQVQKFINRLQKIFKDIPITRYDERYSSVRALNALVEAGVSKKVRRQKERIDSAAAAIILQDFLDEAAS